MLPSSGQAFDEINIVRFTAQGSRSCPVSGAPLKFLRSVQLARTPDFALRTLIAQQAKLAKARPAGFHAVRARPSRSLQPRRHENCCRQHTHAPRLHA